MAIKLIKTNSSNGDFQKLVQLLDNYLSITDGDEHDFYNQFNGIENLTHVIIAYYGARAIACGAIKLKEGYGMEIKRMFTHPDFRKKGVAKNVLTTLEQWAKTLGYEKLVLETGKRQQAAVEFYKSAGYQIIKNYAPYEDMDNSVCFEKKLF